MTIRNHQSPYAGGSITTDEFIGEAYPQVKLLAENMPLIKFLYENFAQLRPRDIEFTYTANTGYIQWRYLNEPEWKNLVRVNDMSSTELLILVQEVRTITSDLTQANATFQAAVNSAIGALTTRVEDAETAATALTGRVTTVEDDIDSLEAVGSGITTLALTGATRNLTVVEGEAKVIRVASATVACTITVLTPTTKNWVFINDTAFAITVLVAAQPTPPVIAANTVRNLVCDGTRVRFVA